MCLGVQAPGTIPIHSLPREEHPQVSPRHPTACTLPCQGPPLDLEWPKAKRCRGLRTITHLPPNPGHLPKQLQRRGVPMGFEHGTMPRECPDDKTLSCVAVATPCGMRGGGRGCAALLLPRGIAPRYSAGLRPLCLHASCCTVAAHRHVLGNATSGEAKSTGVERALVLRQPSQQNSSMAGRGADASSYHTQDLLGQQMPWVQRQLRWLSKNGDAAPCQTLLSPHGVRAPSSRLRAAFAQPGRKEGCSQRGWAAEAAPRAPGGLPDTQGPASETERDVSSADDRNAACPRCSGFTAES